MDLSLLSITLNKLAPTNDISFITTSCNCSYPHVSLFNVSFDNFDKLIMIVEQVCSMLNVLLKHQY
jgi:hypothetical protein